MPEGNGSIYEKIFIWKEWFIAKHNYIANSKEGQKIFKMKISNWMAQAKVLVTFWKFQNYLG